MAINSLVCGPNSNSYVSYEELADRLSVFEWWAALTPTRKENAALLAASALESVPYAGQKLLIGQRLQFPRKGHPIITINYPFLKEENDFSETLLNVTDPSTTSFSGELSVFPTQDLRIIYYIGGTSYTATMGADGDITGTYCSGHCDINTGSISLTFSGSLDVGSELIAISSGYSRITIVGDALKGDAESFINDFLKYGSVRIVGGNDFIEIVGNNPASGEVYLRDKISRLPSTNEKAQVIFPIPEEIKLAQIIQTAHIIDKKAITPIEGVRMIKIGDSIISFTDKQLSYSKYVRVASRYGIHPAAFILIIPFTIYAAPVELARA